MPEHRAVETDTVVVVEGDQVDEGPDTSDQQGDEVVLLRVYEFSTA